MNTALLIIDVQNDFCPGGALAVPDANAVIPVVNKLMAGFRKDSPVNGTSAPVFRPMSDS